MAFPRGAQYTPVSGVTFGLVCAYVRRDNATPGPGGTAAGIPLRVVVRAGRTAVSQHAAGTSQFSGPAKEEGSAMPWISPDESGDGTVPAWHQTPVISLASAVKSK